MLVQMPTRLNTTSQLSLSWGQTQHGDAHVYQLLSVSDEQVAEDASLVQISQADHVLHPVDGGGVHGLDVGGILGGDPVLLKEEAEEDVFPSAVFLFIHTLMITQVLRFLHRPPPGSVLSHRV